MTKKSTQEKSTQGASYSKNALMLTCIVSLGAGAAGGYLWSQSRSDTITPPATVAKTQETTENQTTQPNQKTKPTMKKNSPAMKRVNSSDSLAKAKKVAASVTRQKGTYTLVTVIEGLLPNKQLAANLQLVSNQRRQLAQATAQYQALPQTSVQERELYAGQINDLKKLLTTNLKQMGQAYAYSLQNEYLLMPYNGILHLVDKTTKQVSPDAAHEFGSNEAYEDFQKLRHEYAMAKATLAKLQKPASATATGTQSAPETEDSKPAATATSEAPAASAEEGVAIDQMKNAKEALLQKYNCDAELHYELRLTKSALYAKPIQN